MPFILPESVSVAAHRGLALFRTILRRQPDHFIAKRNQAGLKLSVVMTTGGSPRLCQLCGFAMASIELNDEWLMEACSATGFKEISNKADFVAWLARLSEQNDYLMKMNSDDPGSKPPEVAEKTYTSS